MSATVRGQPCEYEAAKPVSERSLVAYEVVPEGTGRDEYLTYLSYHLEHLKNARNASLTPFPLARHSPPSDHGRDGAASSAASSCLFQDH